MADLLLEKTDNIFFLRTEPVSKSKAASQRKMEGVEQEAGAARPGAHDAPDAVAAHDTIDTNIAHVAKDAATAASKRPKSVADIVQLVLDKAAAEEGAPQGGSAGGGSQKAAEEEGEEGAIADGTHLATGNMDVGTVRRKTSKKDKKENVLITEMARRVRNWGIDKPQNAQHSAWTWGFKYARPPKCAGGFQNHALCALCLVDDLGAATVKLGKDNSPSALVTHLQYSHPEEYQQMWAMEQNRKAPAQPSRSSPRKRPASEVPGAQGHVDTVRSSLNTLFSGVVSRHAPESVHAPMSTNPAGLRSHWAPVESQAEVNRRPDSASVERLFSVAGQVVTAKRNSLHPSTITLLVFLHEAIPGVIEREVRAIIQDKIIVE